MLVWSGGGKLPCCECTCKRSSGKNQGAATTAESSLWLTASKKMVASVPQSQGTEFCQQPSLEENSKAQVRTPVLHCSLVRPLAEDLAKLCLDLHAWQLESDKWMLFTAIKIVICKKKDCDLLHGTDWPLSFLGIWITGFLGSQVLPPSWVTWLLPWAVYVSYSLLPSSYLLTSDKLSSFSSQPPHLQGHILDLFTIKICPPQMS